MYKEFRSAAARIDITPSWPVPLAGFSSRTGAFESVSDRLEANLLLLSDGFELVLFIAFDLLYIGAALRNRLERRLAGRIQPDLLFLAASHTHFAPATDFNKPRIGEVHPAYFQELVERVGGAAEALLDHPKWEACRLVYNVRPFSDAINRRLRRPLRIFPNRILINKVHSGPDPRGTIDPWLTCIRIQRRQNMSPLAFLWSIGCHPVHYPVSESVSSEFPGRAREALRLTYGRKDLPVLFMQGLAGDVRGPALMNPWTPLNFLIRILIGPRFGPFTPKEYEGWCSKIVANVCASAVAEGIECRGTLSVGAYRIPLNKLVPGVSSEREFVIRKVAVGSDLALIGLSAEVVAEYGKMIRRTCPADIVVPVTCIDDVFGYLPTGAQIKEGGYEVDKYRPAFCLKERVIREPEPVLHQALKALWWS